MTLPAALLWDMDGLLVDSEPLWTVAEEELARELGGTWSPELKARVVGGPLHASVRVILDWYGADPAETPRWAEWLLQRVAALLVDSPPLMPGAQELLRAAAEAGVPQALVSSSYRVLVDAVLAHGVGPFALTIAGDEVQHPKPHPEPYLTACERLAVPPWACVVLEDTGKGVASAEAAGCAVVAVPSVHGVEVAPGERRLVLPSLATVDLQTLAALVSG